MFLFWNTTVFCLKVSGPLIHVHDGDKKTPMRHIYEAMNRAMETIVRSLMELKINTKKSSKPLIKGERFSFIDLCM